MHVEYTADVSSRVREREKSGNILCIATVILSPFQIVDIDT